MRWSSALSTAADLTTALTELKREITTEDYFKARIISWPFGLYDCAAQTDGAAAAVITRTDLAKAMRLNLDQLRDVVGLIRPFRLRTGRCDRFLYNFELWYM